jgi:hypothetical protein
MKLWKHFAYAISISGFLAVADCLAEMDDPRSVFIEALETASQLLEEGRLNDALRIVYLVQNAPELTTREADECDSLLQRCQSLAISAYLDRADKDRGLRQKEASSESEHSRSGHAKGINELRDGGTTSESKRATEMHAGSVAPMWIAVTDEPGMNSNRLVVVNRPAIAETRQIVDGHTPEHRQGAVAAGLVVPVASKWLDATDEISLATHKSELPEPGSPREWVGEVDLFSGLPQPIIHSSSNNEVGITEVATLPTSPSPSYMPVSPHIESAAAPANKWWLILMTGVIAGFGGSLLILSSRRAAQAIRNWRGRESQRSPTLHRQRLSTAREEPDPCESMHDMFSRIADENRRLRR